MGSLGVCILLGVLIGWFWPRSAPPPVVTSRVAPYRFTPGSHTSTIDQDIQAYRIRVQKNPNSFMDSAALASLYVVKARTTGEPSWYLLADRAARDSLEHQPILNTTATVALARVMEAQHEFEKSYQMLSELLALRPFAKDAWPAMVTTCLGLGRLKEANEWADKSIQANADLTSHTLRALVRQARGDDEGALEDYRKAVQLEMGDEPFGSSWSRSVQARFHLHRGRLGLAEDLLLEAQRIYPDYTLPAVLLGDTWLQMGRIDDARTQYVKAFSLSNQPQFLLALARLERRAGRIGDATVAEQRAEAMLRQDLQGGSFGHRRELARLLLQRGDAKEALKLMQAERKMRQDAETLELCAWAEALNNQLDAASDTAAQARALGARDARLYYRSAWIELKSGRVDAASELAAKARIFNPSLDPLRDLGIQL